jgi:surface antigen
MRHAGVHPGRRDRRQAEYGRISARGTGIHGRSRVNHNATATILKLATAATIAVALSGCSLSRKAALETDSSIVTTSISKPIEAEGIESTDVEVIKSVVAEANANGTTSSELAWSNPDTGNRGTIMAVDKVVGTDGQECKKFQTTVDNFTGISLYNGETCETKKGSWVLNWFRRDK